MRSVLLAVQYASIFGLFIESWVIFRRLKNSLLPYLFLSCIAILVSNIGYLFQLLSTTEESYVPALKFSYCGRTWITFFLFLFTIEFCKIKLPYALKALMVTAHMGVYISILTLLQNDLYYTWHLFSTDGLFPKILHGNGTVYHLYMALQVIYIVVGFSLLFRAWGKEKNRATKHRLMAVITAFMIECIFFAIKMFKLIPLVNDYDVTVFGYVLSIVFMFIAFFRYDLLGAKEIAKDYMLDRLPEAIISVDAEGNVQYCNKTALEIYPDLQKDPQIILERIQNAISKGDNITVNDRIYSPEENNILKGSESLGKLYALIDTTAHYESFNKEKTLLQTELRIDPMTGLYNRMGMEYFSEKLLTEARQKNSSLFLCICDMNGLKYINDNFGHEEGDRALKLLSQIIKDSLEEGDMAFRIGGDEFLILGLRSAPFRVLDMFCAKIESAKKARNAASGLPYKIDLSYGPLINRIQGRPNEFSDMMKQSDSLMYEMKKNRDEHIR